MQKIGSRGAQCSEPRTFSLTAFVTGQCTATWPAGSIRGSVVQGGLQRSELTEREPDPNKRTNKCNAEAGREGKARRARRERQTTDEKQGKGQEEKSKKHTERRRKRGPGVAAKASQAFCPLHSEKLGQN